MSKLKRILLIDDDEPTNYLNKRIIEKSGHCEKVEITQSGYEALDYLQYKGEYANRPKLKPDLIFLDINMPGMNGWEFLSAYKKLSEEHQATVIVVMLTTSLNPVDHADAKAMPEINAFEKKPLTIERLENLLKKYFPENF